MGSLRPKFARHPPPPLWISTGVSGSRERQWGMPRHGQDLGRLRALAAIRGGVVSPADLNACGFSAKAVRRRLAEGSWHRVGGAVVLSPAGSDTRAWSDQALAWILRLTFGPQMRISGVLALRRAHWHLPCETHIVIVANKPHTHLPGVTILRRPEVDLPRTVDSASTTDDLRFVAPREALVDCLTVLPSTTAARVLDVALQRRYVRPETLAVELSERLGQGRRNAAGLRQLLVRATSGSRSEAEQRMARLLQRSGTGPWIPNHPVYDAAGRVVAEIDFAHVGLRIAIEVDGRAFHSDRQAFERDRQRQNVLTVGGWLVLRFTWEQLTERPDEVISIIRAAIAQRAA